MNTVEFFKNIAFEFWNTASVMSFYLLLGFLIAGVLSVLVSPWLIEKHLGNKGFWPAVKASLFGVPLPLCSCGVIPVAMSLRKHKASKSAVISFLLSTPQTGIDSILVTYSLLGPVFAIFRPLIAFVTGCIGGVAVELFDKNNIAIPNEKNECTDDCCSKRSDKPNIFKRILKFAFIVLPRDIAGAMLIGIAVAAVLSALIPQDFFADKIGSGILAMIIMLLLSVPAYVCATASVPVAAVLLAKGLSPGVVLVFLMAGPATNAVSFITIAKALGTKTAIIYLLTVVVCALIFGILLDYIYTLETFSNIEHIHGEMLNPIIANASAVILLAILVWGIIGKSRKQ